MASLTIKKIPDSVYRSLKRSAETHRRSINSEAPACLEQSLDLTRPSPEITLAGIDEIRRSIRVSRLTERSLNATKRAGRP